MDNMTMLAFTALVLAALADVLTTIRGLNRGAKEGNRLMLWVMNKFGLWWIAIKLVVTIVLALVLYRWGHPQFMWVIAAVTGAVAVHNWRLVK